MRALCLLNEGQPCSAAHALLLNLKIHSLLCATCYSCVQRPFMQAVRLQLSGQHAWMLFCMFSSLLGMMCSQCYCDSEAVTVLGTHAASWVQC